MKQRKFHHLRYNRAERDNARPERREQLLPQRTRTARRNQAASSDEDRPPRHSRNNNRVNNRYYDSDRHHSGRRTQYNTSDDEDYEGRHADRRNNSRSQDRNDDNKDANRQYGGEPSRRPADGHANNSRDIPRIQLPGPSTAAETTKVRNYRDILTRRPTSRTNLKRDSHLDLTRKRSATTAPKDPRDEQIKQLQEQLALANSKNDTRHTPPAPPPGNKDAKTQQAIEFITQTMKALEAFKKDLTN